MIWELAKAERFSKATNFGRTIPSSGWAKRLYNRLGLWVWPQPIT